MQASTMIFPDQTVAAAIAMKMGQTSGKTYTYVKVTTGYQVSEVKVLKPYMPPKKPAPVIKKTVDQIVASQKLLQNAADVFEITLPFKQEGKSHVYTWNTDPATKDKLPVVAFGKSTLITWDIVPGYVGMEGQQVKLRMSLKQAKKRGLV